MVRMVEPHTTFRLEAPCGLIDIRWVAEVASSGLGSPRPHLHQNWARPAHICTRTGRAAALLASELGSPLPHLHQNWARPAHICSRFGLTPATSAFDLGSPRPRLLHPDLGSALAPLTSAPGLGSPRPHLRRNFVRAVSSARCEGGRVTEVTLTNQPAFVGTTRAHTHTHTHELWLTHAHARAPTNLHTGT
jgi:hypothetical protein